MAIEIRGKVSIPFFSKREKSGDSIPTVHVSSFTEAVEKALTFRDGKQVGVIGLDLDKTYIDLRDAHPLSVGKRRHARVQQRQEDLRRLLAQQQWPRLVVWTSRPLWAIAQSVRAEITSIADEADVQVSWITGLDKLFGQRNFRRTLSSIAGEDSSVVIFGNSRQELRGARWAAKNLSANVHHINVGKKQRR